jgi:hypothetical protein
VPNPANPSQADEIWKYKIEAHHAEHEQRRHFLSDFFPIRLSGRLEPNVLLLLLLICPRPAQRLPASAFIV